VKQKNYEDMIMKRAMDVFAEEGLKFFGIEKKVKEVGSTEIVVLEAKNMFISKWVKVDPLSPPAGCAKIPELC
jgi:hypothetical protein